MDRGQAARGPHIPSIPSSLVKGQAPSQLSATDFQALQLCQAYLLLCCLATNVMLSSFIKAAPSSFHTPLLHSSPACFTPPYLFHHQCLAQILQQHTRLCFTPALQNINLTRRSCTNPLVLPPLH
eukprot:1152974-Pelagomonas_calceolata.AAC.4